MSFSSFYQTIIQRFLDNWDTDTTPVKFENEDTYVKGSTGFKDPAVEGITEFVHFFIRDDAAEQADIGLTPRIRRTGNIIIQIFVKDDTREARVRAIADLITPIFQRFQSGGIQFRIGKIITIGENTDNESYYQINYEVPYFRDEINT